MAKKKAILLRHMPGERDDRVQRWLQDNDVELTHVNPSCGIPLPDDPKGFDALVVYGGIQSANDTDKSPYIPEELEWLANWIEIGQPVLGICLGSQMLAKCLGGEVSHLHDNRTESGFFRVEPTEFSNGFLDEPVYFYQWHNEGFTLPKNCELLATGEHCPNQAFRYKSNVYAVQFHPEVTREMLSQWVVAGGYQLGKNGAHPADRQLKDELQYGEPMDKWCTGFMEHWFQTW